MLQGLQYIIGIDISAECIRLTLKALKVKDIQEPPSIKTPSQEQSSILCLHCKPIAVNEVSPW